MSARTTSLQTAVSRQGGGRFLLCALFAVFPLISQAADSDPALARVQALIRGGASELALRLLEAQQPAPGQSQAWQAWERERYALYRVRKDWSALQTRVEKIPSDTPAEFVRWARTEAARARLDANDPAGALVILRAMIWSGAGTSAELQVWRQLVIRAYLLGNQIDDAGMAVARYRAEYQPTNPAWRQLEAATMLRAGQPRDAYALIADLKTHDAQWLTLLAGLRATLLKPEDVQHQARKLADETRNRPAIQYQVWLLAAEAAERAQHYGEQVYALERALTLARAQRQSEQLVTVHADDLWKAYGRYAEHLGNEARLLVGDDALWLKKAEATKRDDAMDARAIYALLWTHGTEAETRALAARRLTESLIADGRNEVLRALFTEATQFADVTAIPAGVRHRLAEQALTGYDIRLAASLLQGLTQPPEGESPDSWVLRRARIEIYAGKFPSAVERLNGLLQTNDALTDEFIERYLQALFDLQAASQHEDALRLLEALQPRVKNHRSRREILYWMAESHAARGANQQAAELYLRSAYEHHPTGGDPWGQTARYHAAEALGQAGLTQDARLVFQALLKHTEDAKQRAVIERNIQQLWLIENKRNTTTP